MKLTPDEKHVCEFVVGWLVGPDGESPGDEVYCKNTATHVDENGVKCCPDCAAAMQAEGFTVERLPPNPSTERTGS